MLTQTAPKFHVGNYVQFQISNSKYAETEVVSEFIGEIVELPVAIRTFFNGEIITDSFIYVIETQSGWLYEVFEDDITKTIHTLVNAKFAVRPNMLIDGMTAYDFALWLSRPIHDIHKHECR